MDGPWEEGFEHESHSAALMPVLDAVVRAMAGMGATDVAPSLTGAGGGEHLGAEAGFMLNGRHFSMRLAILRE